MLLFSILCLLFYYQIIILAAFFNLLSFVLLSYCLIGSFSGFLYYYHIIFLILLGAFCSIIILSFLIAFLLFCTFVLLFYLLPCCLKMVKNREYIRAFPIWAVLANQISRKYFVSPLAPINAGKIVKNTKNIQGFQMRPVLANQGWEKNFLFTIGSDKCWKNRKKILKIFFGSK